MAGRVADSAAGLPARSQATLWPRSLSRRPGSRLPARLTCRVLLLDVHAGLTSGHASVTPNCEADDEQSRCRLFAPTQVPAATRAAPQRPSIPQAQAVQTPAVADEVLGGRWTPTPVRPRNRRSATTSARSGSTPTAGRRSPRKRSGPAPARSAITSHSTPGATSPVHRSGSIWWRTWYKRGLDHRAGPVVGDPDDASGRETDLVASSLVLGRARCRKSRLVARLVAVLPLAGWSSTAGAGLQRP